MNRLIVQVAVALGTLGVLSGCQHASPDSRAPGQTTLRTPSASESSDTVLDAASLGARITTDTFPLTAVQATCFAKGLLGRYGSKELADFQVSAFVEKLPNEDQAALFTLLQTCVATEDLETIFATNMSADGSITQDEALCFAEAIVSLCGIDNLRTYAGFDYIFVTSASMPPAAGQGELADASDRCIPLFPAVTPSS